MNTSFNFANNNNTAIGNNDKPNYVRICRRKKVNGMTSLTAKELTAIEDQLSQEQNLISKYSTYAQACTDPQLKGCYEEIVTRHRKHFDALFGIINCCNWPVNVVKRKEV